MSDDYGLNAHYRHLASSNPHLSGGPTDEATAGNEFHRFVSRRRLELAISVIVVLIVVIGRIISDWSDRRTLELWTLAPLVGGTAVFALGAMRTKTADRPKGFAVPRPLPGPLVALGVLAIAAPTVVSDAASRGESNWESVGIFAALCVASVALGLVVAVMVLWPLAIVWDHAAGWMGGRPLPPQKSAVVLVLLNLVTAGAATGLAVDSQTGETLESLLALVGVDAGIRISSVPALWIARVTGLVSLLLLALIVSWVANDHSGTSRESGTDPAPGANRNDVRRHRPPG